MRGSDRRWTVLIPVVAACGLIVLWLASSGGWGTGTNTLVVYCAHDSVYADEILKDFEQQTGIHVDVRYDTEATKSLGLINLILQERRYPRCDVFWNNELLGTLDLQSQGLLEPYQGDAWNRLPEKFRDEEGHWVGFGARLRVVVVNTQQISADAQTVNNVLELETTQAAIAKPIFGTTLTHYTVLWHVWGSARVKAWHHELRMRGIREVNGNGPVKDLVAQGICELGFTDTDDAFVALDEKQPVAMLPVRIRSLQDQARTSPAGVAGPSTGGATNEIGPEAADASRGKTAPSTGSTLFEWSDISSGATICIPNTAAMIRGTKHRDAARKLIDFLASAQTELALARSKSRQVPLGPVDDAQLPEDVRRLKDWTESSFDLRPLLPARRECLNWLKTEYAR